MKTLIRTATTISLYLVDDSVEVDVQDTKVVIGNPPQTIVWDCNSSNSTLYTDVTDPGDWEGWKYFYTPADGWVLNPDWIPPESTDQGSN